MAKEPIHRAIEHDGRSRWTDFVHCYNCGTVKVRRDFEVMYEDIEGEEVGTCPYCGHEINEMDGEALIARHCDIVFTGTPWIEAVPRWEGGEVIRALSLEWLKEIALRKQYTLPLGV